VPIKVRRRRTGDYELVWGHRRLYADELAGLSEISALVEDMVEEEVLRQQIVENLCRMDKMPIEEAEIFETWSKRFNRSYEEIARKLGLRREYIYNRVELLKLTPDVRTLLKTISSDTNRFWLYHARLLLKVKDPRLQYQLALETVRHGLISRELMKRIEGVMGKCEKELEGSQGRPPYGQREGIFCKDCY
jgi:ParB family chromosome partitioning protein